MIKLSQLKIGNSFHYQGEYYTVLSPQSKNGNVLCRVNSCYKYDIRDVYLGKNTPVEKYEG